MQDEIDQYLMNNNFDENDVVAMGGDRSDVELVAMSAGHSPTKTAEVKSTSKMHQMLETQTINSPDKLKTVKPYRHNPSVIYVKNRRDDMLLLTEKDA